MRLWHQGLCCCPLDSCSWLAKAHGKRLVGFGFGHLGLLRIPVHFWYTQMRSHSPTVGPKYLCRVQEGLSCRASAGVKGTVVSLGMAFKFW